MEFVKEEEFYILKVGVNMMDNLKMIKEKVREYIIIIMGIDMKGNGKMIKKMEMQ